MNRQGDADEFPSVLDDVTVIEVTRSVSGAQCGRLLAEFGADVILVEAPDGHRLRGVVDDPDTAAHYFETLMAGKRSIVVDDPTSAPIANDLFTAADVLVTDFESPPEGFTEADTIEQDHDLLYCSLTPFGDTEYPPVPNGNDPVVQAMTGITGTSGFDDSSPAVTAVPIAASMAAIVGCGSILARLYEGSRGGRIDVSMYDAILPLLTTFLPESFATDEPVGRSGNHHPLAAPWNTFRADDDWVYFIAWTDSHWRRFLELAGREDLADDPRFETNQRRKQNEDEIDPIIKEWIEDRSVEEVIAAAEESGITAAPIRDVQEAFEDTNLRYRDMIVESNGYQIIGSPFVMSETPGRVASESPEFDEDETTCDTGGDPR